MTLPSPYYQSDRATLYQGDCLAILPHLGKVDAVVTDPPYGMKYRRSGNSTRSISSTGKVHTASIVGDDRPFDPSPWLSYPCVFTGAQWFYDRLPPNGGLHCWDKRGNYKPLDQADADMVWCSERTNCRVFHLVWRGLCRHAENNQRIEHPTQKPVALMEWMLSFVPEAKNVLDPYCGSGSTGVACIKTGRKFIGIEIDEKYCEIAAKRIRQAEREQAETLVGVK